MGWTVHYAAILPGKLEAADFELLQASVNECNARLSEGSEPYAWRILDEQSVRLAMGFFDSVENEWVRYPPGVSPFSDYDPSSTYLQGFTKIHFSKNPEGDFVSVVSAVKVLAERRPGWRFRIHHDYAPDVWRDPTTIANAQAWLHSTNA